MGEIQFMYQEHWFELVSWVLALPSDQSPPLINGGEARWILSVSLLIMENNVLQ